MRARTVLAALGVLLLVGEPAAAHENSVRYRDPRMDAQADVWWSSKAKIHVTAADHRQRFQAYGWLGPDWSVEVFVDSRGGPRADFKLWSFEDLGTSGCGGRRLFGPRIAVRCDRVNVTVGATWKLWWGMRRNVLRPTKPIRWRVTADYPGEPVSGVPEIDTAPDRGWYL
jgi:hypothetical protein